jgi:hypothetical protein
VDYSREAQRLCIEARGEKPGCCIPRIFRPKPSFLYKNNGDGTFRDVSRETGIASKLGKALGVVATDINNDGLMDLFVTNDTVENFRFTNRGGRGFEDGGILAVALRFRPWPVRSLCGFPGMASFTLVLSVSR